MHKRGGDAEKEAYPVGVGKESVKKSKDAKDMDNEEGWVFACRAGEESAKKSKDAKELDNEEGCVFAWQRDQTWLQPVESTNNPNNRRTCDASAQHREENWASSA